MDKLISGQSLNSGDSLTSPNGKHKVTLQLDGNLVIYDDGKLVWATGTKGSGAERAEMRFDGNLVLYGKKDKPVWASSTQGNTGASLAMHDDRNLVLHDSNGKVLWASATSLSTVMTSGLATPATAPAPTAMTTPAVRRAAPETMPAAMAKPTNAAPAPMAKPAVGMNPGSDTGTGASIKQGNRRTYTVGKGDSLWRIAEKFYGEGQQYKKIAKANGIHNPDLIRLGQSLIIPD